MKNHLIQKMELLQKQNNNSDEVTHDSQNTEIEFLELISFLHQFNGLNVDTGTVLDAKNAVTLQVLTTISYNSNVTPCVQGMKLLKQECGSKLHPSPSSPSNTGFSALRLFIPSFWFQGMVAWLANPHM